MPYSTLAPFNAPPQIVQLRYKVHHESTDPSPFAAFSFHPLEAMMEAGFM